MARKQPTVLQSTASKYLEAMRKYILLFAVILILLSYVFFVNNVAEPPSEECTTIGTHDSSPSELEQNCNSDRYGCSDKYSRFMDNNQNYSSVWCTGMGNTRTCLFTNVCYDPTYKGWVFYEESTFNSLAIKAGTFNVPNKIYLVSRGNTTLFDQYEKYAKFQKVKEPFPQNATWDDKMGLLFTPYVAYNPGHAYIDDLMPIYWLMYVWQEVNPDNRLLLWSPWAYCQHVRNKQLTKELLVMSMYQSMSKHPLVCLREEITTPLCFRKMSVGTYGLGMKSPTLRLASPIFRELREYIASNMNITNQPLDPIPEVVWVSHRSVRRLLNEDDIIQKLRDNYSVVVHKVQWEDLNFYERFKILSKAVIRIGFFGTSSITHLYMRTGTINLVICSRTCGNEIGGVYEPGIAHVRSMYWKPSNESLIFPDRINYPNNTAMAEQQADLIIDYEDFKPTWEAALYKAKSLVMPQ